MLTRKTCGGAFDAVEAGSPAQPAIRPAVTAASMSLTIFMVISL
jgi:hypothetical protein